MSIKDWNIEGIAEGVIREMKEDGADIGNIEDYIREVFWTVYSRDVDNADLVAKMVKKLFVKNTKRRTLKMKFDLKKLEILEANSEGRTVITSKTIKLEKSSFSYCLALPDFDSPYGPLKSDEDLLIGDLIAKKMRVPLNGCPEKHEGNASMKAEVRIKMDAAASVKDPLAEFSRIWSCATPNTSLRLWFTFLLNNMVEKMEDQQRSAGKPKARISRNSRPR